MLRNVRQDIGLELSASHEGLCSSELVSWFVSLFMHNNWEFPSRVAVQFFCTPQSANRIATTVLLVVGKCRLAEYRNVGRVLLVHTSLGASPSSFLVAKHI